MRATKSAYSIYEERTREIAVDVVVRAAEVEEHSAVAGVLLRAYQEYEPQLPPEFMVDYLTDLVDIRLRASVGAVLVAHRRQGIVGTATFYPDASQMGTGLRPGWAGVRALAVDPGSRKLGVAEMLMYDCMARARAIGARMLALHTGTFMTAAMALYVKLGFRRLPAADFTPGYGIRAEAPRIPPVKSIAYALELP
jgi:GNAT superfamily N-acetyltransferase